METEKPTLDNAQRIEDPSRMREADLERCQANRRGKPKVEIRDKKGLLRSAIPDVSVPVAWTVLFFNVFAPGSGTTLLAVCCLCGIETSLKKQNRCLAFWLNVCTAILQLLLSLIIIGWIWSVFWGMHAVTEANNREQNRKMSYLHESPEDEAKQRLKVESKTVAEDGEGSSRGVNKTNK